MTQKMQRAQILFEPSDYRELKGLARRRGCSVGEVVRKTVKKELNSPEEISREEEIARKRKAYEKFLALGAEIDWDVDDDWDKIKHELSEWRYRAALPTDEADPSDYQQ